tara:strand:- start:4231 stop:5673 length:1443 start_codon:yes stop_codon:yes gene_type:complete
MIFPEDLKALARAVVATNHNTAEQTMVRKALEVACAKSRGEPEEVIRWVTEQGAGEELQEIMSEARLLLRESGAEDHLDSGDAVNFLERVVKLQPVKLVGVAEWLRRYAEEEWSPSEMVDEAEELLRAALGRAPAPIECPIELEDPGCGGKTTFVPGVREVGDPPNAVLISTDPDALEAAARLVVERWGSGDLAGAVRALAAASVAESDQTEDIDCVLPNCEGIIDDGVCDECGASENVMTFATFQAGGRRLEWAEGVAEIEEAGQSYPDNSPDAVWTYPGGSWMVELADGRFALHLENQEWDGDHFALEVRLHKWAVQQCNLHEPVATDEPSTDAPPVDDVQAPVDQPTVNDLQGHARSLLRENEFAGHIGTPEAVAFLERVVNLHAPDPSVVDMTTAEVCRRIASGYYTASKSGVAAARAALGGSNGAEAEGLVFARAYLASQQDSLEEDGARQMLDRACHRLGLDSEALVRRATEAE